MMPNVISENQHHSSRTSVKHPATREQIELVSFGPEGHGWKHWRRSKLHWVNVSVSSDLLWLPEGNSWNRWCAGWVGQTDFILHGFCKHISFCRALLAFHFLCTGLKSDWWGAPPPGVFILQGVHTGLTGEPWEKMTKSCDIRSTLY